MRTIPRLVIPLIKVNHVFLVPWIVFSLPATVLFEEQLPVVALLVSLGVVGMLARNRIVASLTSVILLALIVWGKAAGDIYHLAPLDTALLLVQFLAVIFLMEASNTAVVFDRAYRYLEGKNDDVSAECRGGLITWMREQLKNLATVVGVSSGLSLGLLILGDLVSVSVNQIAFSGVLVLAAVIALLFLLTYGREPEDRQRSTV